MCSNLCKHSECVCNYCKKNYNVSSKFYKAKRLNNNFYVEGYLVKNKIDDSIEGILNKSSDFYELAWIDENTLEPVV